MGSVYVLDKLDLKQHYSVDNCAEARANHPWWINAAQQVLIAGHPWDVAATEEVNFVNVVPLILRPWASALAISIKAVLTDEAGTVGISLNVALDAGPPATYTQVSLNQIALDHEDLDTVDAAPTTQAEWQAIEWYAAGSLGSSAPSGDTKASLQFTPANEWRDTYLVVSVSNAKVHDIKITPFASNNPLT